MGLRSLPRRAIVLIMVGALVVAGPAAFFAWLTFSRLREFTERAVIAPGCPAVLVGSNNAAEDFADMVTWQGRFYVRTEWAAGYPESVRQIVKDVVLDDRVATVNCSLADRSSTDGQMIAPGPWPDGTATGLPKGTVLHALRGVDTSCALGALTDSRPRAYVAVDVAGDWTPFC
ncbi:hypothetical protein [Microlunatus soli]|uniref:Uncharacterized protein n=1 Tax=Microlunatus soli TaxID=630515 RepID=A0A1H1TRN3_9ACTN|nr:hypothetical protein [Microlunatus soli]SDS62943.1 hypothetical protein SAMN04489812_2498 [Microlunatus soli]